MLNYFKSTTAPTSVNLAFNSSASSLATPSLIVFGAPPHAGIAPGIDRMLMLLSNSETIREVIAFPLNSKAQDLMMGAPGNVRRDQLRDVHIEIIEK